MKKIKALLLRILGQERYLKLTGNLFFLSFHAGWLKNNPSYYTHYFVRHFIKPGQTVIDIGANLGYYSLQFAHLTGVNGKLFSVEPISLYRNILVKNLKAYKNVTILPYALGEVEGKIKMGNPGSDKHRHGLMRVLKNQDEISNDFYKVDMKNPADLFKDLPEIDYIKCDIEGYEVPVIPLMQPIIAKHQPVLQIETEGENYQVLYKMLKEMSYHLFYVNKQNLVQLNNPTDHLGGDLIAIPAGKIANYTKFIKAK